jgi:hypothetical protein
MVCAASLTFLLDTAKESFDLILSIGAGTGLIYILRWFWWRINAWSEVSAMISSFLVSLGFFIARKNGAVIPSDVSLVIAIAITTIVWLVVTFVSTPTERGRLHAFYTLVRPAGPGWEGVRRELQLPPSTDSLTTSLVGWIAGCSFVYAALFGTGSFLYGRTTQGVMWLVLFVVAGISLLRLMPRMWRDSSDTGATS